MMNGFDAASCNRIFAKIDLDHLIFNYTLVREKTGRPAFAVIKADAYGHGAVEAAHALSAHERRAGRKASFAVATAEEAMQLRRHGVEDTVLLLGTAPVDCAQELSRANIIASATSFEHALSLSKNMRSGTLRVHVKLETGMNRCGVPHDATEDVLNIARMPHLKIEGLYTHLCVADDPLNLKHTKAQIAAFTNAANRLREKGLRPMLHAANSAASIAYPHAYFDAVRPGVMLYGHDPCNMAFPLRPVMSLHARVMQVKPVAKGDPVGYGCTWEAPRPSRVAVVPVGYADGLFRSLSGKIDMLIRGKRAPQVGRICMDMCMLDVTEIEGVRPGDTVTILGADGENAISVEELSTAADTIPYEIFCAVGRRVPRLYYQDGALVERVNYVNTL
ncbi:alanine racemase [Christensenellaceae bacterium OttesenSCG-928-M15]|nr:alanine racemase [Christensenellaceae bacterium OttesenSCG-928-M15]